MVTLLALSAAMRLGVPVWLPESFDTSLWTPATPPQSVWGGESDMFTYSRRPELARRSDGAKLTIESTRRKRELPVLESAWGGTEYISESASDLPSVSRFNGSVNRGAVHAAAGSDYESVLVRLRADPFPRQQSASNALDHGMSGSFALVEGWAREALSLCAARRLLDGVAEESNTEMTPLSTLGLEVSREPSGLITVTGEGIDARFAYGSAEMEVNGTPHRMPDILMLKDGEIWIPREAAERLRVN